MGGSFDHGKKEACKISYFLRSRRLIAGVERRWANLCFVLLLVENNGESQKKVGFS